MKTRPKNSLNPTFHRSILHSYSVRCAVVADCPIHCRCWVSHLQSVLSIPSRVCCAHAFVPGWRESARYRVSSGPILSSRFNEKVLTIICCGIHPVSSALAVSFQFNETVLTISYPARPYSRPGPMRWCSWSSNAASTPFPELQVYHPGLLRWCSFLQPYCPCLSSPLHLHILRVCFLQSYPPNAPSSSAHHCCVLQVCFSLPSPHLVRVHFAPPSASPASKFTSMFWVLPLSSQCASQWRWWKNKKFPLTGPLCEAHSVFPSPLAAN